MQPIFYITLDPERALSIENIIDNYHIITPYSTPTTEILKKRGFKVLITNKQERTSGHILQNKAVQDYIAQHTSDNPPPLVMTFKISSKFALLANKLGYQILNTTPQLNQRFERKLQQAHFFIKNRIHTPKMIVLKKLSDVTFEKLQKDLNSARVVIQFNIGHTGNSTVFVQNSDKWKDIVSKFPKRPARAMQFIDGESWTINAVITKVGIFVDGLSYQLTGLPECTSKKGATVGNDWSRAQSLDTKIIAKIYLETKKIGHLMYNAGFQGMSGLDFIIDKGNNVYVIEINARQTASVPMHGYLQQRKGLAPFMLLHTVEFLSGDKDKFFKIVSQLTDNKIHRDIIKQQLSNIYQYSAKQVFYRNKRNRDISIDLDFKQGIYDKKGKFIREEYSILDLNDGEVLRLCQPNGKFVKPNGEMWREQVVD